ncbi:uncharacterized protein LOC114619584 [Grammomys surdaster]|uniref:uncharacterized protein LOC114619584 n=1 Tax=Grammomys surdaster TaxID=491861 RepID=UPI00109FFF83|nr:uncharacterized protein LOC114619584 [Grammomys surdaster]
MATSRAEEPQRGWPQLLLPVASVEESEGIRGIGRELRAAFTYSQNSLSLMARSLVKDRGTLFLGKGALPALELEQGRGDQSCNSSEPPGGSPPPSTAEGEGLQPLGIPSSPTHTIVAHSLLLSPPSGTASQGQTGREFCNVLLSRLLLETAKGEREATPPWSLSWYIQKYVSWILRIRKERTETGCCIPDEDIPQRKRHFVHGTRIRLWPPSRVKPTYPNDVSNRVIMEVVPCVSLEEEDEDSVVGKVESSDKENITLEDLMDPFHPHRRSEESIEYPSWNVQRQWDWSSDEENCEGHSISVTALVHTEACLSDTTEEEEKAEAAMRSQDDISKEGGPVAAKTEAAAL